MTTRGTRPELILHPVRMRIIMALAARRHTAKELRALLPDVAQASLYRHLSELRENAVVTVVAERREHGGAEQVYALSTGAAQLAGRDLENATVEDHFRYFAAFAANLIGDFSRYLARGEPDLESDGVGYREVVLHVTDEEFADFLRGFAELVGPLLRNEADPTRTERRLATVTFPVARPEENSR
ncbi:helix-turn-helix domain-containing protein [Actinosynnema sp. NPDC020468]|uniref:helix-turn-helix domain-containing protein n=1 Tax=Actinosynnema sp. NPDC020468 TaxID=3154488 RepID=UPI0033D2C8B9